MSNFWNDVRVTTAIGFNQILDRIAKVRLSLEFILAGFDDAGEGHLYIVDGEHAPANWDTVGFCAIGTGSDVALGTLAFHVDRGNLGSYFGWPNCVYCVCDAKFRAESASDVGKATFLTVYQHNQDVRFISPVRIDNEVRVDWERRAALPKPALKAIKDMMFAVTEFGTQDAMRRFLGRKRTTNRQAMREYEAIMRAFAHHDQNV